MKKLSKKVWIMIGSLCLAIIIIIAGCFMYYTSQLKPVSDTSKEVIFEVKAGEGQRVILDKLEKNGLIKNPKMASICIKLNGYNDIKFGIFKLNTSWSSTDILKTLNDVTKAKQDEVMITFKEGIWAKDIAASLEKNLGVKATTMLSLWNDDTFIKSMMKTYPFLTDEVLNDKTRVKLEGYLFPETYVFSKKATPKEITETFLKHFSKIYEKQKADIKASGMSVHDLVKLASVVQYEASSDKDMKLVAGVFENRLKINMKLQSSVTVCYALYENLNGGENCEIKYNVDSPYNTYQHEGLPIGPILNPGEQALAAVLKPTASEYLYFVADVYGDGKVYYAKTHDEQLANQAKFNLNK